MVLLWASERSTLVSGCVPWWAGLEGRQDRARYHSLPGDGMVEEDDDDDASTETTTVCYVFEVGFDSVGAGQALPAGWVSSLKWAFKDA